MNHLELVFDDSYGRRIDDAVRNIQAEAEKHGVPEGTTPTIDVQPTEPGHPHLTITTYRWEWEE
jgi:hypothetical protein